MTDQELDDFLELFYGVIRRIIVVPESLLASRRLGRPHHRALYFIRREPGISVRVLAGRLAITPQALHRVLSGLIRKRFVRSVRNPANRRLRQLTLTETGRSFEKQLTSLQHQIFADASVAAGRDAAAGWAAFSKAIGQPVVPDKRTK